VAGGSLRGGGNDPHKGLWIGNDVVGGQEQDQRRGIQISHRRRCKIGRCRRVTAKGFQHDLGRCPVNRSKLLINGGQMVFGTDDDGISKGQGAVVLCPQHRILQHGALRA
jgi:hypothetical protein